MHRVSLPALLALGIVGCSNPLPFGPGRVAINLDEAKVLLVDRATLFPGSPASADSPKQRESLELVISSRTELLEYFAKWDRHVQVRCSVEGNLNGRSYKGFAFKPVLKRPGPSKSYQYTIYAFIDLQADDIEYVAGRPATTFDLRTERFESLKCHLLGVTKAPVLFPRSNDIVVPGSSFRMLLRQSNPRSEAVVHR
jgi:hypothetical protein